MRMDHYLKFGSNKIHWLAIGLSTFTIIFFSVLVIFLMNN